MTKTTPFALIPEGPTLIAIHDVASYDEHGGPVLGAKIGDLINLQDLDSDGEDIPSPEWRVDAPDGTEIVEIGDFTLLGEAVAELRAYTREAAEEVAAEADSEADSEAAGAAA